MVNICPPSIIGIIIKGPIIQAIIPITMPTTKPTIKLGSVYPVCLERTNMTSPIIIP